MSILAVIATRFDCVGTSLAVLLSWQLAAPQQLWAQTPTGGAASQTLAHSNRITLIRASTRNAHNSLADLDRVDALLEQGANEIKKARREGKSPFDVSYGSSRAVVGVDSKADLVNLIADAQANEFTTLVCYLKLHGTTVDGVHVMELDGVEDKAAERITRAEVLAELAKHKLRLTILITESCSYSPTYTKQVTVQSTEFPRVLFEDLFVRPAKVLDLNSSTFALNGEILNQFAWMDQNGGIFTRALNATFQLRGDSQANMLTRVGKNPAGHFTWKGFYCYLGDATNEQFLEFKKTTLSAAKARPRDYAMYQEVLKLLAEQKAQLPFAWTLPD